MVVINLDPKYFKPLEDGVNKAMAEEFMWIILDGDIVPVYRPSYMYINKEPYHDRFKEEGIHYVSDAYLNDEGIKIYKENEYTSLFDKRDFYSMQEAYTKFGYKSSMYSWFIHVDTGILFVDHSHRQGGVRAYEICSAFKKDYNDNGNT